MDLQSIKIMFMEDFMYCSECGKEIPSESKFCYFCGAKVVNIASCNLSS